MTSILRRLTTRLLVAFTLLATAAFALTHLFIRHELLETFDNALTAHVLTVASLTEEEDGKVSFDYQDSFRRSLERKHRGVRFLLCEASGSVLASSRNLPADLAREVVPGTLDRPKTSDVKLADGTSCRMAVCDFSPAIHESPDGAVSKKTLRLFVVMERRELDGSLARLTWAELVTMAVLLGVVLRIVPKVVKRDLSPLGDLAHAAGAIDARNLSLRFPSENIPEELRVITFKLNECLTRLEQSFERERRFGADISHELRTPIAELKSLAECALRWPDLRNEETCADMLRISRQMESLVTRMLSLVRCETDGLGAEKSPVDVNALIAATVPAFERAAAAREITVVQPRGVFMMDGDEALLRAIFANLIENAVSYSPVASEVRIVTEIENGRSFVEITNPAPELTREDIGKIFDSFWRKTRSRTDRHAGLGTTLSRAFAAAMGMELTVGLDEAGNIRFRLG